MSLGLLLSCDSVCSKGGYISSFEKFIIQTTANGSNYSEQDWLKADISFREFVEKYYSDYKDEMTDKQREEINKLRERYIRLRIMNDSSAYAGKESLYGEGFDFL
ncbi:MAG: DUF6565 domain-containing protein [Bacteroidales bacterium]